MFHRFHIYHWDTAAVLNCLSHILTIKWITFTKTPGNEKRILTITHVRGNQEIMATEDAWISSGISILRTRKQSKWQKKLRPNCHWSLRSTFHIFSICFFHYVYILILHKETLNFTTKKNKIHSSLSEYMWPQRGGTFVYVSLNGHRCFQWWLLTSPASPQTLIGRQGFTLFLVLT